MTNSHWQLSWRKKLIKALLPKYSSLIDRANRSSAFVDFLDQNTDKPRFETRYDLYRHIHDNLLGGCAVDYLEFGVFKGESLRFWTEMNKPAETRFYGFDSFRGLPEDWYGKMVKGTFDVSGILPDIKDDRVNYLVGWFQETVPNFLKDFQPRNRLVLHNDSDLYSSTLYMLSALNHLIVPGTVVIFDEFADVQHEWRALNDYSAAYMRKWRLIGGTDGAWVAAVEFL